MVCLLVGSHPSEPAKHESPEQARVAPAPTEPVAQEQAPPSEVPASAPDSAQELQPVVVIGAVDDVEDIDTLRKQSVVPLTGITREEFTQQPKSQRLGDIVDRLPSVNSPNGLPGENKDTGARGMSHQFTRFEFDGVQLPAIGNQREFRLNRLSPMAIGSVILLRSPSAEYEGDGFGGRFVVTRREIPADSFLDVRAGTGLQYEPERAVYGHSGDFAIGIGKRVSESFGFTLFGEYSLFPQQRRTKTEVVDPVDHSLLVTDDVEIEDKYWENLSLLGDFAWFYGDGELHVKPYVMQLTEHRESERTRLFPAADDTLEARIEDKPRWMLGLGVENEHHVSPQLALDWQVGFYHAQEEFDRDTDLFRDTGTGFAYVRTDVIDRTTYDQFALAKANLTRTFDEQGLVDELKGGLMLRPRKYSEDDDTKRFTTTTSTLTPTMFTLDETYYAAYGQARLGFGELDLLPGVRFEHVDLRSDAVDPDGMHSDDGSSDDLLPSLHAVYHLTEDLSLRASVSRGVTRPRYSDLSAIQDVGSTAITVGNPGLEPMRAWSYDVGIEHIDDSLLVGATLFYKDVAGLIEAVDTGEDQGGLDVLRYSNVGDGYVAGLELEQRVLLADLQHSRWELWANQTLLDSEVTDADGEKRPFNITPELLANFGLIYDHLPSGFTASFNVKYQDGYENDRVEGVERTLETWYADLLFAKSISPDARITLEVFNLLDTEKRQIHDYVASYDESSSSIGRSVRLGLEFSF